MTRIKFALIVSSLSLASTIVYLASLAFQKVPYVTPVQAKGFAEQIAGVQDELCTLSGVWPLTVPAVNPPDYFDEQVRLADALVKGGLARRAIVYETYERYSEKPTRYVVYTLTGAAEKYERQRPPSGFDPELPAGSRELYFCYGKYRLDKVTSISAPKRKADDDDFITADVGFNLVLDGKLPEWTNFLDHDDFDAGYYLNRKPHLDDVPTTASLKWDDGRWRLNKDREADGEENPYWAQFVQVEHRL